MSEINTDMFNFNNIVEQTGNPFAQLTKTYETDTRFYKLSKNEDGKGGAIIRFLPDAEMGTIKMMFLAQATVKKDGKQRFVSEFSPQTIGLPCPFQEKWAELWSAGLKEEAKVFSRGATFISNIYIVKDPANPDNEGKVFLYKMSGAMKDKIESAMVPSENDIALGAVPKEMFNPIKGYNFKLSCAKGSNNQITYDSSSVVPEPSALFEDANKAFEFIKENCYKLSDLLKPEEFKSYDELKQKLEWVQFKNTNSDTTKVNTLEESLQTQTSEQQIQEVKTENVDADMMQAVTSNNNNSNDNLSVDDLINQM